MIKVKIFFACLIFIMFFSLNGCGDKEDVKVVDLNKTEEKREAPDDAGILRIGLIPEQDIRKMAERYEPLAAYLSRKLNLKVSLIYLNSYSEICDKFVHKELDAAFFGSLSYALTHYKIGIEPIARPDYGGVSTYRGLVIVSAASGIKNAEDMKNKRLALVHRATYAGYLYPLYYFKQNGINDPTAYFSSIVFAGSHDKAISDVLRGEADIAIAKDLVYQRMVRDNPDLEGRLVVLAGSKAVPSNALCATKELDTAVKAKLKRILIGMAGDDRAMRALKSLGGATRFIETRDEDYKPLYMAIKALGLDLSAYPYYDRQDIGFSKAAEK